LFYLLFFGTADVPQIDPRAVLGDWGLGEPRRVASGGLARDRLIYSTYDTVLVTCPITLLSSSIDPNVLYSIKAVSVTPSTGGLKRNFFLVARSEL
jgi:hypothetical protein